MAGNIMIDPNKLIGVFLILLVLGLFITKMSMILKNELKFLGSRQQKSVLEKIDAWFGIITSMPIFVVAVIVLVTFFLKLAGLIH
jgi:hypothetical protein